MMRFDDNEVISLAEQMIESKAKGHGVQVMDTTCTVWDLTHVSPHVAKYIADAADLAELQVEVTKVGDYARIQFPKGA